MFYLWHTSRQGWITTTGTTSTQRNEAAQFTELDAARRAKVSMDYAGNLTILPISVSIIEQIAQ